MKRERGFTLVELAIVLVVIGILLGAVLKGQDLIQNARAKKAVSKLRAWEVAIWTYMDQYGRFPGDSDKDGKIGDGNVKTDLINASFINPPYEGSSGSETNTITIGSVSLYVYLGTDNGSDSGKNIIILCKNSDCDNNFSDNDLIVLRSIDTSLDGIADGTDGQVICTSNSPTPIDTQWKAYYSSPTATTCDTSAKALVYYFDAKR